MDGDVCRGGWDAGTDVQVCTEVITLQCDECGHGDESKVPWLGGTEKSEVREGPQGRSWSLEGE